MADAETLFEALIAERSLAKKGLENSKAASVDQLWKAATRALERCQDPQTRNWRLQDLVEGSISFPDLLLALPSILLAAHGPLSEAGLLRGPAGPDQWEREMRLKEVQGAYVHSALLLKKAKGLFAAYVAQPSEQQVEQLEPGLVLPAARPFGFLWLLFITARASLLPTAPDLISSYALLLACLAFLLCHLPSSLLRGGGWGDAELFPHRTPEGAVEPLLCVAAAPQRGKGADLYPQAKKAAAALDRLLLSMLPPAGLHAAHRGEGQALEHQAQQAHQAQQQQQQQQAQQGDGVGGLQLPSGFEPCCALFEGLFDASTGIACTAAVRALDESYQRHLDAGGLLDERDIDLLGHMPQLPAEPLQQGQHGQQQGQGPSAVRQQPLLQSPQQQRQHQGRQQQGPVGAQEELPERWSQAGASPPSLAALQLASPASGSLEGAAAPAAAPANAVSMEMDTAPGGAPTGPIAAPANLDKMEMETAPGAAAAAAGPAAAPTHADSMEMATAPEAGPGRGDVALPAGSRMPGEEGTAGTAGAAAFDERSFRTPSPPAWAQQALGPLSLAAPATPLTQALECSQWVQAVTSLPEGEVLAQLGATLLACGLGPAEMTVWEQQAQHMAAAVFLDADLEAGGDAAADAMGAAGCPGAGAGTGAGQVPRTAAWQQQAAQERRREALSLYYQSAASLLQSELARISSSGGGVTGGGGGAPLSPRLGASTLSGPSRRLVALLSSRSFHASLMACAAECVIGSYQMPSLPFPLVLERLDLPHFELLKVMDRFVRHAPAMPREVKRHLLSIQERVLESLAWQPGSSLYPVLLAACGRGAALPAGAGSEEPVSIKRARLSPGATAGPGAGAARSGEAAVAGTKAVVGAGAGAAGNALQGQGDEGDGEEAHQLPLALGAAPTPGGDPLAHALLSGVLERMLSLAAVRLADLLETLELGGAASLPLLSQSFTLLRSLLLSQTWLVYGRHLDQLMLCAVYGVCKVHQLEAATFKSILGAYRQQPQARPETYKSVSMRGVGQLQRDFPPAPSGDIIAFYNKVFLATAKSLIVSVVEGSSPAAPLPSNLAQLRSPSRPRMPPPPPSLQTPLAWHSSFLASPGLPTLVPMPPSPLLSPLSAPQLGGQQLPFNLAHLLGFGAGASPSQPPRLF